MSDDRSRKRDTPNDIGPNKGQGRQVPRGAGLSGNLPAGSRYADEQRPGHAPISVQNEPRRDPRRDFEAHAQPPRHQPTSRAVDGFAATRPAEGGPARSMPPNQAAHSNRPYERGVASSPRPPDPKTSLRLKLSGDTYYEAREGRAKVPKRRGPMFFGVLILLLMLGGGSLLWIDAHGGIDNFVTQLERLWDPDAVATTPDQAAAPGAAAAVPAADPNAAAAQPSASAPGATPGTDTAAPAAAAAEANPAQAPVAAQAPGEQPGAAAAAPNNAQVATGEVEAPDEAPAAAAAPPAEKPKPVAKPAPKPVVKRPPVRRDPVLKVKPIGDVLGAAPPDPEGKEVWTPPPPPAPE